MFSAYFLIRFRDGHIKIVERGVETFQSALHSIFISRGAYKPRDFPLLFKFPAERIQLTVDKDLEVAEASLYMGLLQVRIPFEASKNGLKRRDDFTDVCSRLRVSLDSI